MEQGSGFPLQGIGVLLLGVSDLQRAVTFYSETLGLPLKSQIPGFAFLKRGPVTLALSVPFSRALSKEPGAVEIVWPVDYVRLARQTLLARGVSFVTEPRNVTGKDWSAVFTDPDGHRHSIFGLGGRREATDK